jgi:nucleotide-binding universal stress UspA family protein
MSLYKTILVTLEGTPTDRAIIEHIKPLAKAMQSRVVLLHVASGVPAKYHGTDAAGKEVEEGKAGLERVRAEFAAAGIPVEAELAYGDPVKEIVNWVNRKGCDLVAMSTHGIPDGRFPDPLIPILFLSPCDKAFGADIKRAENGGFRQPEEINQ